MAHETYYTEGIVLGGGNVGEGHRILKVLTRDFGMISAHARSIREERSKLRYSVQQFSETQLSLVQGREGWKVTGAEQICDHYVGIKNMHAKVVLSKIGSLLRRLVQGEVPHEALYECVQTHVGALSKKEFTEEEYFCFEYLFVLRILHALGYAGDDIDQEFFDYSKEYEELFEKVSSKKIALRDSINRALLETQL